MQIGLLPENLTHMRAITVWVVFLSNP